MYLFNNYKSKYIFYVQKIIRSEDTIIILKN